MAKDSSHWYNNALRNWPFYEKREYMKDKVLLLEIEAQDGKINWQYSV